MQSTPWSTRSKIGQSVWAPLQITTHNIPITAINYNKDCCLFSSHSSEIRRPWISRSSFQQSRHLSYCFNTCETSITFVADGIVVQICDSRPRLPVTQTLPTVPIPPLKKKNKHPVPSKQKSKQKLNLTENVITPGLSCKSKTNSKKPPRPTETKTRTRQKQIPAPTSYNNRCVLGYLSATAT